jgi:hypothetical protein
MTLTLELIIHPNDSKVESWEIWNALTEDPSQLEAGISLALAASGFPSAAIMKWKTVEQGDESYEGWSIPSIDIQPS